MKNSDMPISAADIDAAARVIAPYAVRTPLLPVPTLDTLTGGRVFVKPEVLQRTGSFKFRGAFNKLSSIPQDARGRGVVAFSSGNHAQGVAAAAQILGMKATIVMPADAPAMKVERTRGYGAEVVLYDRLKEDREAIARKISGDSGATVVPPYDDVFVMAGQGTVGLEIAEDLAALGAVPDIVSAQASGGGLVGGIAVAVKARFADASIIVAEPAGFHDHDLSLKAGKPVAHGNGGGTICDALMAQQPGEITFAVNKYLLAGAVSATDQEVMEAMAFAFRDLKLVVEPGGAVALAALLTGRIEARGKTVVIVLSGGNVDPTLFSKAIGA
ncbi:MAG: threonine/serine dehydratase [Bradyrhizobiaceae bacterium]|nr:MAG: threonine/serine dehydratase [Bradyrhizobiaceae bacterium]